MIPRIVIVQPKMDEVSRMIAHDIYFVPLIRTWALINGMGASSPCPSIVMITHTHIYLTAHDMAPTLQTCIPEEGLHFIWVV